MSLLSNPNPWPLPIEWLPTAGPIEQLILLLHGAGDDGRSMAPLAQALRSAFAQAAVLAPDWPVGSSSDGPNNAPADVAKSAAQSAAQSATNSAAQSSALRAWVQAQQHRLRVAGPATALAGFGHGANAALATAAAHDGLAGRVLVFAGGLPTPAQPAPRQTTVHLFHGADDTTVPADAARKTLQWLADTQGDATLDIAHGVGHDLHPALIDCALHRLRSHIPLRTWQAALGAAPVDSIQTPAD